MKTFTQISISLALTLGLGSVALAGDAAKAPATPAKKEAPPADAKKAPEAPKKMEPMKAPQELADMAKMMAGTWKCTGKAAMDPADMSKMSDMKMTMKMSLDTAMGGWWLKGTMDAGAAFKGEEYVTYDPSAKKWIQMMRDSMGGSELKTSMGMKDNKMVWEGDSRMPMAGMGAMKSRETHDLSDMKTGAKMMGEASMDGKTWMKVWEATCKK
jgi:hypothetical protein